MSLVRKIYIDSRTCSGNPADFTATLPEPIRADPTLGVILSQLTFVNNFETVMRDYTNRLYFGIDLGDTNGLVQTNINDRVYMRVIDDAEAGPNDRIFVIPPATYTLATFKAALQTAFRVDYPDWTVGDTITTPGSRVIIPTLGEITNPAWYNAQWRGEEYNPQDSRSLNGFFSGTSMDGVWTGTISLPKRGVLDNVCVPMQSGQYDGPGFAAELQTALRNGVTQATGAEATNITVAYNASQASLYVTSPTHPLRIYSAELLRDARWVGEVWYSPANDRHGPALTSDPMDINRKLAPPQTFANTFATGQIDLSGLREVYVHCPTLSDGSSVTTDNRRDVIATVVCDVPWGQLVSYRPYSFAERELLQLNNEIPVSLRFYLTDGYGRRLPPLAPSQYLFMQLSILAYDYIDE
jgi:hypothetical protein